MTQVFLKGDSLSYNRPGNALLIPPDLFPPTPIYPDLFEGTEGRFPLGRRKGIPKLNAVYFISDGAGTRRVSQLFSGSFQESSLFLTPGKKWDILDLQYEDNNDFQILFALNTCLTYRGQISEKRLMH